MLLTTWSRYALQTYCNYSCEAWVFTSQSQYFRLLGGYIYKSWQQSLWTGSSHQISSGSWPQTDRLVGQGLLQLNQTWPVRRNTPYRHFQYVTRALVTQHSSLAPVYLRNNVTLLFMYWTERFWSRLSKQNYSLFYWNRSCLGHGMHCVESKQIVLITQKPEYNEFSQSENYLILYIFKKSIA